jgi:hypothetical protein
MQNHSQEVSLDHTQVVVWPDSVIDHIGHDPRSTYAEKFWLGVIGPSALWLLRHLVTSLEAEPEGFLLDYRPAARQLGLGAGIGTHSPFRKTLKRLESFEIVNFFSDRELGVRKFLPVVSGRQLSRLGRAIEDEHRRWLEAEDYVDPAVTRLRWRARRIALGLVALGDDFPSVELELLEWRLHPALASDAASWAWHRAALDIAAQVTVPSPS